MTVNLSEFIINTILFYLLPRTFCFPGKRSWLTARHAHYFDASGQDWTLQGEAFTPRPTLTTPSHLQDVQSTNSSSFVDPEHSLDCVDGPSGITFIANSTNELNIGQNINKNDSSGNLLSQNTEFSHGSQSANVTTVKYINYLIGYVDLFKISK